VQTASAIEDSAQPAGAGRRWRLAALAAAVYLLLGMALILRRPGLQYDEAMLVSGAVHMLNAPGEFTLPHDPDTWACLAGRCFPLMTVRYVGAAKEYLYLPLAGISGSPAASLRMLSLLLSALGIWGVWRIWSAGAGARAGAVAAWLLAICPSYLTFNVFDNGAVSMMMAAFGLLLMAGAAYLREQGAHQAFLAGMAAGLGIWARANFVWILAALGAALLAAEGMKLFARPKHWLLAALGAVCGGLPFLLYQIQSRGGTLEAVAMFRGPDGWGERISVRLLQFAEILQAGREHRAMWNGPETPEWQVWLFPAFLFAACAVCLAAGRAPLGGRARAVAAMFLVLATLLFSSGMAVSEHHLIVLVPVAAAMVAAALEILRARLPWFWIPAAAAGVLYAGSALNWHRLTLEGLERTGGVSVWSDGVYSLAAHLDQMPGHPQIKILDWGLQNNLYVLTRGRLKSREIFGGATRERSGLGRSWREEIHDGGVFVLFPPANRQFPLASEAFLDAVREAGVLPKRWLIRERTGEVFVEVLELVPGSAPVPRESAVQLPAVSRISMGDPGAEGYIEGFHQIEEGAWRWSGKRFAVTLIPPSGAAETKLALKLFVPPVVLERMGPVTLRARIGSVELQPATYSSSGIFQFERDLNTPAPGRALRIEFSLDKALPPSAGEGRELGIIVHAAELLAK
jgi:hypothetical protein